MDNTLFSPTDWPAEFIELQKMDQLLRCGICYEYLNVAMMTICSHNYCSVCIRKYMSYKSSCPTCFVVRNEFCLHSPRPPKITSEPELKTNRVLDQLVQHFNSLRCKLLQALKTCDSIPSAFSNKRKSEMIEDISKKKRKEGNKSRLLFENVNSTKQNVNGDIFKNSEKVDCPVCGVGIPSRNITRHVEECLNKSESTPKVKEENKLKPLPKLVYHLMSDRDLKVKLKQHGLNTLGERTALIKRHHSFTILYNANCDSLDPKPISALVRQVEKEEKITAPKTDKINFLSKKEDPIEQEQQVKGYLKAHKCEFDKLIENIKQRGKSNSTSKQTSNAIVLPKAEIDDALEEDTGIVESVSETDLDTTIEDDDIITSSPDKAVATTSSVVSQDRCQFSRDELVPSPILTSHCQVSGEETLGFGHSSKHHENVIPNSQDSNSSEESLSLLQ